MNRKISAFMALILIVLCTFQFFVTAEEHEKIEAAVSYSVEKSEISVMAVAYGNTIITVLPADEDKGSLSDENLPVVLRVVTAYGRFSDTIVMPDGVTGGKYTVYVSTPYGEDKADFVYINLDDANEIIMDINSAESAVKLESVLKERAIEIGIDGDDEVFKNNTRSFANMLNKKDYADIIEFSDTYFEIYPLVALRGKNADEVKTLIRQHESRLGIEFEEDIENDERLSSDDKDRLFIYMTKYDFEKDYGKKDAPSFKEVITAYKRVSVINGIENWVELKKIITDTFSEDFTSLLGDKKYKCLKDKDKVFEIMMKHTYSSPDEIEEKFAEAVNTCYKKENPATSGGSSSSSGGGSFGGGSSGGSGTGGFTTSQDIPKPGFDSLKVTFSDVEESFWGYEAIDALAADDIIKGYVDGSFRPSGNITRAEFTKIIVCVIEKLELEIDDEQNEGSFNDVSEKDWHSEYINKAYKKGIIFGSDGNFYPNNGIKREDAAVIIYRLLDKAGNKPSGIKAFADRNDFSDYASEAISALGSVGMVSGSGDNKFLPQNPITRAEAAQLIYNAFIR